MQPHLDAIASGGRLVIEDSLTYAQTPVFKVDGVTDPGAPGIEVVVTARNGARPLIALAGDTVLDIGARGTLVLEGLVISGGALQLAAAGDLEPRELVLRDCTLVPGLALNPDGAAASPGAASLVVEHPFAKVTLERCITGPLMVVGDAEVVLADCIVDAGAPENVAYAGNSTGIPGARAHRDRVHRDRQAAHQAPAARVEQHLLRAPRAGAGRDLAGAARRRAPPGGLRPLLLRAAGLGHAAALSLRAR